MTARATAAARSLRIPLMLTSAVTHSRKASSWQQHQRAPEGGGGTVWKQWACPVSWSLL